MTDAPFVDEGAEMERVKVNRQREVHERKFSSRTSRSSGG